MLHAVIKKNSYQDSVNLMLLTKTLSSMENVNQISVMMGTPANIDIFKNSGLYTEKLDEAGPNDICVVVDSENPSIVDEVMAKLEDFIKNQAVESKKDKMSIARTWESAINKLPGANLALISIAGEYVAKEANKALDKNLNVFIFSDNVSIEDEKQLKEKASQKGLLVMGPDCGTGIVNGIPLAFANVIDKGNIGIIGASGTGIQEVSTLIGRKGGTISQAIGLGGRDLSKEIGGITATSAIAVLEKDPQTDVVVFISKPPAKEVRDDIVLKLKAIKKPVVAIFIGEKPSEPVSENVHYAWTLEDTANIALGLADSNLNKVKDKIDLIAKNKSQRGLKGLYSGGTLAAEAAMIFADSLNIPVDKTHEKGLMLENGVHKIVDLGDDFYTKGKPHPMIDPEARLTIVKEMAKLEETAILLLDVVIGYGGHDDMAGVIAPVVSDINTELKKQGKSILFVASVTGTEEDPQVYAKQVKVLEDASVVVLDSNAEAIRFCLKALEAINSPIKENSSTASPFSDDSMWKEPKVINVGLKHFTKPILEHGGQAVHYVWNPIAGGNKKLEAILEKLK